MRLLATAVVAGSIGLFAFPAAACSPWPWSRTHVAIAEPSPARAMYARATSVAVVELASAEPIDVNPWIDREIAARPAWVRTDADERSRQAGRENQRANLAQFRFARLTLRVVEALKGGREDFTFTGVLMPPAVRPEDVPRLTTERYWWGSNVKEAEESTLLNDDCAGLLGAREGERYLVFRGPDGRLLKDGLRFRWLRGEDREPFGMSGLNYERADERDLWLRAVRRAARHAGRRDD